MVAETCRRGWSTNAGASAESVGALSSCRAAERVDDEREIAEKCEEVEALLPKGGAVVFELIVNEEGCRMWDLSLDTVGSDCQMSYKTTVRR
jgi:hypothetical protein